MSAFTFPPNIVNWAEKYDLASFLPILHEHGFNTLEVIGRIDEKDLDSLGITKVGDRKKILLAVHQIKDKIDKLLASGGSLADISKMAYLEHDGPTRAMSSNNTKDISDSITYGDVELAFTYNFDKIYDDSGSGAHKDMSIFCPKPGGGFRAFGCVAENNHKNNPKNPALVIKASSNANTSNPPVKEPDSFSKYVVDKSNNKHTYWKINPPNGYVALGFAVAKGGDKKDDEPSKDKFYCIRKDLTTPGVTGDVIWKYDKNDEKMSLWGVVNPVPFISSSKLSVNTGCFTVMDSVHRPTDEQSLDLLLVPTDSDKTHKTPNRPALSSYNSPVQQTEEVLVSTVRVPFNSVKDSSHDAEWKYNHSAFYKIQRYDLYNLMYNLYNSGSTSPTYKHEMQFGVTKEETNTFNASTSISVSSSFGVNVGYVEASVSATVGVELGYSNSTSVAEMQQTTESYEFTIPPRTNYAVYSVANRIYLKRADDSLVSPPLEFNTNSLYTTQYPNAADSEKAVFRKA